MFGASQSVGSVLQMGLEGLGAMLMIIFLVPFVLVIAGQWKVFTKAGEPGWAAIIPIFNLYVLLKVVGRPAWWLVLFIVPLVNIVVGILVMVDLAKAFGKGALFAVGLLFLPIIFFPVLGFGGARYQGAPN